MCYLTTVVGSFHGRVLAARLGAEGVIVVLKGTTEGPYPIQGTVDVLVPAHQLGLAREILLADAVDDVFTNGELGAAGEGGGPADRPVASGDPSDSFTLGSITGTGEHHPRGRLHGLPAVLVVVIVAMMIVGACLAVVVR